VRFPGGHWADNQIPQEKELKGRRHKFALGLDFPAPSDSAKQLSSRPAPNASRAQDRLSPASAISRWQKGAADCAVAVAPKWPHNQAAEPFHLTAALNRGT